MFSIQARKNLSNTYLDSSSMFYEKCFTSDILINIFPIHISAQHQTCYYSLHEYGWSVYQSPAETGKNDLQNVTKRQTNVKYFIIDWWPSTFREHWMLLYYCVRPGKAQKSLILHINFANIWMLTYLFGICIVFAASYVMPLFSS